MKRYLLFGTLFVALSSMAQTVVRKRTIANGYDNNRLVRTHLVAHYYHHSADLTDGYVLMLKPTSFLGDTDSSFIRIDTLCRFSGQTRNSERYGTFLFLPMDNVFYLETYKGHYKNGPCTGYFYTGNLHSQVVYKRDRLTGIFRRYHANGRLAVLKKLYEKPADVMEYQSFAANGQILSQGVFYENKKVHEWKYYNPDGTLSKIEYYNQRGKLMAIRPQETMQGNLEP